MISQQELQQYKAVVQCAASVRANLAERISRGETIEVGPLGIDAAANIVSVEEQDALDLTLRPERVTEYWQAVLQTRRYLVAAISFRLEVQAQNKNCSGYVRTLTCGALASWQLAKMATAGLLARLYVIGLIDTRSARERITELMESA